MRLNKSREACRILILANRRDSLWICEGSRVRGWARQPQQRSPAPWFDHVGKEMFVLTVRLDLPYVSNAASKTREIRNASRVWSTGQMDPEHSISTKDSRMAWLV